MKILTPEEEAAHNKTTLQGGLLGAAGGLLLGGLGVYAATQRYHAFRQLSAPFRVFLVTSSTSFGGVIMADRYSRAFEASRHSDAGYVNQSESLAQQAAAQKSGVDRFKAYVSEQRYPIVFGSWAASMAIALGLVGRNPYMTGQQKLVQARVYAQGLTLAVLVASFMLEGNDMRAGKGRWETVKVVDPDDPEGRRMIEKQVHHEAYEGEDQWMDMMEAQEQKMKSHGRSVRGKDKKKDQSQDNGNEQDNQKAEQGGNENDKSKNGQQKKEAKSK